MVVLITSTSPTLLAPVLDPVFNKMFQKVCSPHVYTKQNTAKNHNISSRLSETIMAVQKVMAQIIVLLGHYGTDTGLGGVHQVVCNYRKTGAAHCTGSVATESLGEMCGGNILQLLTTRVPSVEQC